MTASSGYRWPVRGALTLALALLVLAIWLLLPGWSKRVYAQPPEPHQYIGEYEGPATCATCHGDVAEDVIHAVHYTWAEKMDHYSTIAGTIARINWLGMLNEQLGIPGGCARCHVGDGSMPKSPEEVTPQDKAGIDCLICHSPIYDTSLRLPVQNEDGTWTLTQDRSILAARQAQRPDDQNCLFCHLNVGGGPNIKRGVDFAPVSDKHGAASLGDVHADAGMVCVDCHRSQDHKILGYGPTIWSRDLPEQRLTCDSCHTSTPHQDPLVNKHVRLDCRACHVPGTGGLISRDWTAEPSYDPLTELYAPEDDVREANSVQPVYRWFNGEIAVPGEPWPAERFDEAARIQPFKQFDATVPVDASSGEPVPLKLDIYYTSGDIDGAVQAGADESGMDYSGQWEAGQQMTLLQISHGVVGKENTVPCQECHVPDGRLDFAELGYTEDETALLSSLSSAEAGERQSLRMRVVVPEPRPLPTPVLLSGNLEAARGFGLRIPWSPVLAILFGVATVAVAGAWLWRQRPAQEDQSPQTPGVQQAHSPGGSSEDRQV